MISQVTALSGTTKNDLVAQLNALGQEAGFTAVMPTPSPVRLEEPVTFASSWTSNSFAKFPSSLCKRSHRCLRTFLYTSGATSKVFPPYTGSTAGGTAGSGSLESP